MRETMITLNKEALKLVARRWFLLGFKLSGHGFHGESTPDQHKGIRSLLIAYFENRWNEAHQTITPE